MSQSFRSAVETGSSSCSSSDKLLWRICLCSFADTNFCSAVETGSSSFSSSDKLLSTSFPVKSSSTDSERSALRLFF